MNATFLPRHVTPSHFTGVAGTYASSDALAAAASTLASRLVGVRVMVPIVAVFACSVGAQVVAMTSLTPRGALPSPFTIQPGMLIAAGKARPSRTKLGAALREHRRRAIEAGMVLMSGAAIDAEVRTSRRTGNSE